MNICNQFNSVESCGIIIISNNVPTNFLIVRKRIKSNCLQLIISLGWVWIQSSLFTRLGEWQRCLLNNLKEKHEHCPPSKVLNQNAECPNIWQNNFSKRQTKIFAYLHWNFLISTFASFSSFLLSLFSFILSWSTPFVVQRNIFHCHEWISRDLFIRIK